MNTIKYLLFDLDDTLYTNASGLFREVGERIEAWLAQTLGLSQAEAQTLRRQYYQTYGTTMAGLLQEHPEIDIEHYLHYVHTIDVSPYLSPDPALDDMLSRLPAPKAIFTNSIAEWAERVTQRLGIRHHFTEIFDVRGLGYQGKPHPQAYSQVLQRLELPGEACVLLDDQPSYLHGAAQAGMHTILVGGSETSLDGVEFAVGSLLEAEPILMKMLTGDSHSGRIAL